MDRRDFVHHLAGLPLVFGAWKLGAPRRPTAGVEDDALKRGLERMRATGLPGLVFVIPEEPKARMELGKALYRFYIAKPAPPKGSEYDWDFVEYDAACRRGLALTTTCVMICLEETEARTQLGMVAPRLLVDARGKVVRMRESLPSPLEAGMFERLMTFVHGPDQEGLKTLAAEAKASMSEARKKDVELFLAELATPHSDRYYHFPSDPGFKARADRVEKLITEHPKLVAWMALALLEVTSPNPTPLQAILSERSAQLPLGSVLPVFWGSGCGGFVEVKPGDDTSYQNRPMPACGMPSLSSTGGRFLRFVGEK